MAEVQVAVLHVERPETELMDGRTVTLELSPESEGSFGLDRYCALDGGDHGETRAALRGIGFTPHERLGDASGPATVVVPVVLLSVTVPTTALRGGGAVDLTVGSGGSVVSIGGGQQFALEGKDYDETCAALLSAGFDLHRRVLDALEQATLGHHPDT